MAFLALVCGRNSEVLRTQRQCIRTRNMLPGLCLAALLCVPRPSVCASVWSSNTRSVRTGGIGLQLRGGLPGSEFADEDFESLLRYSPFGLLSRGPKPSFLRKGGDARDETSPPDDEEAGFNPNYFKPPFPMDLQKGETKESFRDRLRSSFSMLEEDEFTYTFYERFWPQYKTDKRIRAAYRNEDLAPHLQQVFDEDEATEGSWFVPYSEQARAELGDHPNATAYMHSILPRTPFKDPTKSPEHALWEACQRGAGDEEIYKLAMQAESVDATDVTHCNWTAAHYAAERGHVTVIEVLAALKADMWAVDSAGQTPLHVAIANFHHNVVDVLQDVFDVDAERDRKRHCPPDPPPQPRGTDNFERVFLS